MTPGGSVGATIQDTVLAGSLALAVPLAVLAGLVSFLSPCVLPLLPGYLSYVTGLSGADLAAGRRGRVLAGALLFVAGFGVLFVSYGALFGGLGAVLLEYSGPLVRVLGVLTIVLGLMFAGWLPGLSAGWRLHATPRVGLAGAPVLGVLFGLGWTPCFGPTLAAVQVLAFDEASAGRGAALSAAYVLGLGLPFVAAALAFRRALGVSAWVRRHQAWVLRTGGAMLVVLGVLLVTGLWSALVASMQGWIAGFQVVL